MLKSAKHEHFAQLVAGGKSPEQAYIIAGYSKNGALQSASRLLKNADILLRVNELTRSVEEPARERAIEKAAVDKAWVLSELIEVVGMAKQAIPVLDAQGAPTGEYRQNLAAANKSLELLGKELGMFVDRSEVRTGPLDGLTHEELREFQSALESVRADSPQTVAGTGSKVHH